MRDCRRVARVVLDTRLPQLDRLFDYLIPEGLEIAPGVRVKVPLRSAGRFAEGFVIEVATGSEHPGKLASLESVISLVPVVPPQLWRLAQSLAARGAGSPADVLRLALPKRYVKVEKAWWESDAHSDPVPSPGEPPLDSLHQALESVLVEGARTSLQLPYGMSQTPGKEALPAAVEAVASLAKGALGKNTSVIIAVPDWRDIEHYRGALSLVLPDERLLVLSGDQTPASRYLNYLRTLEPTPHVVLGNRHALYAPAHQLGLVIVVDDADSAHREPLAPYPHSRDIALVRNSGEGVAVCFAGVQASLAVQRWVDLGFVTELALDAPSRPRVIPTALSLAHDAPTSPARLPSSVFQAVKTALGVGPVLVQVFRAGYSPGLSCAGCTGRALCAQCGGPLRASRPGALPSCAWCGVVAATWACPDCAATSVVPRGQGIGRTMSDLGKSFPTIPIVRSDGDNAVSSVARAPTLVVATRGAEPTTPGGYPLVLLLDGASMLQRDSLGALEESIQAWEHAISFASRDGVVFATDLDGPPALALAAGNWTQLLRHELSQRLSLGLPPAVRIASLSGPASEVEAIHTALRVVSPTIDVLGPVGLASGGVTMVVRFPYAQGDVVTAELGALRHKLASGPKRSVSERVKIVVDDPLALDALTGE